MIKKGLVAAAVAVGLGTVVFGGDLFSYARTWGSSLRESVKAEVPLEFEVKRARNMVENLVPQIRRCMHVIAEQQVDVEHLDQEISRKQQRLSEQKQAILALRDDLKTGNGPFQYANQTYTAEEVRRDLEERFGRYKVAQDALQRQREILAARRKALKANQNKLQNMLASKEDLEVKVEHLQARLKTLQAAQTVSTLEIDDSQLAKAKKLIGELNKQLDVREKMLDAEGKFTGVIPVEEADQGASAEDVARKIDAYFDRQEGSDKHLAKN